MKILLVKPKARLATVRKLISPTILEPLELGYLAASVPKGHDVRVLDLRLARRDRRRLKRELRFYEPNVVGFIAYTHEASIVIDLARQVRQELPLAKVVVGGQRAWIMPWDFNLDCFDAIVRGDGCAPFRSIIERLQCGESLGKIDSVLVPGDLYDKQAAAKMPVYPGLKDLTRPRRDLWNYSDYRCLWLSEYHPRGETIFPAVALVRSSFGCRMNCSFCAVPALSGRKHFSRDAEDVVDELSTLPVRHVYFCDDEIFSDPQHARALAEAIDARGIHKRYFMLARSTSVNRYPHLFEKWRKVGLDGVFLGMESISDEELASLSKGSTVADNQRAHETLRGMGIAVQAGFMVGADYSKQDFARLREYISQMPPAYVTFTVYAPSPGSDDWYRQRQNYIARPSDLHDCRHPLTETVLPLRRFFKELASLVRVGASRSPLRLSTGRLTLYDRVKIAHSGLIHSRALIKAHRDYRSKPHS